MHIKFILSILILVMAIVLCYRMIVTSLANQDKKTDFSEINHVKYGLFSVDKWKSQILDIISTEITRLNLSHANEVHVKRYLELQLDKLIGNVYLKIREKIDIR